MSNSRVTAAAVAAHLRQCGGSAVWPELVDAFSDRMRAGTRELKQVLRGMLRNGELEQGAGGAWYLVDLAETVEGIVQQHGKTLSVEGHEIERQRGSRIRAGDRVRARIVDDRAQVDEILDQSTRILVGELNWMGRFPYVESLATDYRGRVHLVSRPDVGTHGDIVHVEITGEDGQGLSGRVVDVVHGETVLERAIQTQVDGLHIPAVWPPAIGDAVAALPAAVPNRLPKGRLDLRGLPLVTIDGETAKDFDDAVFCARQGVNFRLVVAIADVGNYVKAGGAIDMEARTRGNSVYLPGTVIPMLPEELSNELCSLKPQVPRLAVVCDMVVTSAGRVREFSFHEALIRSWQRLTYTGVAAHLKGETLDVEPEVLASIEALHRCFRALVRAREKRGGLDFETHESRLELRNGRIAAIHPEVRNDAHRLIEEAMIAANVCAAEFVEQHGALALYRVHGQPEALKLAQLRDAFAMAGVHLAKEVNPRSVQTALEQIAPRPDAWIFQMLVLRSMQQAVYQPGNIGHFGLALSHYMHFTSPIRRYADLVVHRAIKAILRGKPPAMNEHELAEVGAHISFAERRAEQAERGVDGWLKCDFVGDHVGEEIAGRIGGVTEFGLFVELDGYYVQGLVHISELGQDYFRFQPHAMALVGDRSGMRYRLGDAVRVRVREVRPPLGRIDLELVRPGGGRTAGPARREGGERPPRGGERRGRGRRR